MSELLVIETTHHDDANFNDDLIGALTEFGQDLGLKQTVIPYEEAPLRLEQIQAAHAVIVAGVPFIYPYETAEDLQPSLAGWIHQVRVPVLGICLGHQAIGLAFGATMLREEEVEVGLTSAEIMKEHQNDPLFKDLGRSFEIASLHWASISIEESTRLDRLALSQPKAGVSISGCENQIIRVNDRPIYGTQFHPENTDSGKKLLKNFLELPKN